MCSQRRQLAASPIPDIVFYLHEYKHREIHTHSHCKYTHTHGHVCTCVLVQVSKSIKQIAQEWSSTPCLNSAASQQQQQQLKIFSVCAAFASASASASFCKGNGNSSSNVDDDDICTHSVQCDKCYWNCAQFHIAPCACVCRALLSHCARKYNVWKWNERANEQQQQ